ncbi:MATE family efflux transporter [Thermosediminibacter oceani]|uniref:Probable multidrug resistance protein NorM n=1 Tax=Thermosediminibacter oceani (strain ATCC BAA-1034 / DSM 16646 / JW/IW-1228P) TaxID=555079 RepID=D9S2B5_THEOJ|nr:MATE family efflux transporter [Thermosediminibacter oceani]ADL07542.1 MATE efflux family protein [Thermosediminibacter oceani DSM 16646]
MKQASQAGNRYLLRKRIMSLAWPAILEMISGTIVWTVDTAMVGRLSAGALSAVGLGAQLAFTVTFVFGALGVGTSAMVARSVGAGENKRADYIAGQALLISLVLGAILGLLYNLGAVPIFRALTRDPVVASLGADYLKIVAVGVAFMVPTLVMNSALRGAGNTTIPMISAATGNILNIIGDYALIFGNLGFPRLEVKGAAIATTFAQIVAAAVTFGYVSSGFGPIKLDFRKLSRIDLKLMGRIVSLSLPASMEELSYSASRLISAIWINRLGTTAFAAHQVAVSAESMSFMPGYGFSVAASTMVGQNLGARDEKTAELAAWEAARLSVFLMSTVGAVFFLIPGQITGLFTNIPEVGDLAARCLRIGAFEQATIAVAMTFGGVLRGAGDTKGPFTVTFVTLWLVRLPLIFTVVFILRAGLEYVWVATVIQYFVEALLMAHKFKKGYWKKIEL